MSGARAHTRRGGPRMGMRRVVAVGAVLLGGVAALVPAGAVVNAGSPLAAAGVVRAACGLDLRLGFSHCNAQLLAGPGARPLAASAPSGYGPPDLQSAYALA